VRALLLACLLGALALTGSVAAQPPATLDELLEQVRRERAVEREEHSAREQRFLAARDERQRTLAEAQAALAELEDRSAELQARYDEQNRVIAERRALLNERLGTLEELFAAVRQSASDTRAVLESSLVSAQLPGRAVALGELIQSREVPTLEQLEALWHVLLEEMAESGKVARFDRGVISAGGEEQPRAVTRVGVFTAVSDGQFLRYLPETDALVELGRQPGLRSQRAALALERAEQGYAPMDLDPTRGTLLGLLVQSPGFMERIRQGGGIGYVIMGLGAVALLLALERFIVLTRTARKVRRQLRSAEQPAADNPLGRVMAVYSEALRADPETLGLKLDEAILRELPRIQRGLATIAILAAVAPLLGLLGTVTGMIQTFQSITLFGTGDPKLMSGGISLALVTTQQGLAVAIPILLLHGLLSGRANRIIQILDEQSAALVARSAERSNGHAA
jgi:biopolymer transport protein ExbB